MFYDPVSIQRHLSLPKKKGCVASNRLPPTPAPLTWKRRISGKGGRKSKQLSCLFMDLSSDNQCHRELGGGSEACREGH